MGHPLNVTHSLGMAQVVRGLEGFAEHLGLGTLRLAIVDIIAGLWKLFGPKQPAPAGGGQ